MKLSLILLSIKNNLKYLTDFDSDLAARRRNNVRLLQSFEMNDSRFENFALMPLDFTDEGDASNLFSLILNSRLSGENLDETYKRRFWFIKHLLKNPELKMDIKIKWGYKDFVVHDLLEVLISQCLDYKQLKKSIDFLFEKGFTPNPQKNYIFQIVKNIVNNHTLDFDTALDIVIMLGENNCNLDLGARVQRGFVSIEETPLLKALTSNNLTLTKTLLSLGASYNTIYMQTYSMNSDGKSINESFDYLFNMKKVSEEKNLISNSINSNVNNHELCKGNNKVEDKNSPTKVKNSFKV